MQEIDIVIPTFNRADYLKLAIDSVLKQTSQQFQLYILDNCSEDNTKVVVKSFSSPRVSYIENEANLGMVGNWNRALKIGNNNFLHIFHDDDLLEPDFVQRVSEFYKDNADIAFLHTGAVIIDNENNKIKNHLFDYPSSMSGDDFFIDYLEKGISIICPSVVMQRSKLPSNINFDENLPFTTDVNFWVRISKYGKIGYIKKPIIRYRHHLDSGTGSLYKNIDKKIKDRFYYKTFLEKEIMNRKPDLIRLKKAPENYLKGSLTADIWFVRRFGNTLRDTMRIAKRVVIAHPPIIKYPRFWLTLIKICPPLFVMDFIINRKMR